MNIFRQINLQKIVEGRAVNLLAAGLLLLMFGLAILSAKDDAATSDEVAHIGAGYSYLTQRDYRLNPEHPPLIKDLAALPLLFLNIKYPENSVNWETGYQWGFGREFIYETGNDADKILFWARLPMILLMIILGMAVFILAKKTGGNRAGILALILFVFCPTIMAHGRLVTNDVGAALAALLCLYFWVAFLKKPDWKNLLAAGVVFGLSLLIKFTLLILIPILGIMTVVYGYLKNKNIKECVWYIWRAIMAGFAGFILIVGPVFWLNCLDYSLAEQLKYTTYPLSTEKYAQWEYTCREMANSQVFRIFSPFCAGATMGAQISGTLLYGWETFLFGEISQTGFWYYFPAVYLFKMPLAFHLLAGAVFLGIFFKLKEKGFAGTKRDYRNWILKHFLEFSMIVFILVYWIAILRSILNIGVRHLIPIFPLVYILTAVWAMRLFDSLKDRNIRRWARYLAAIILGWYISSSLGAFPYYLTYFNELCGGPKMGYKCAVDSNYDWGQDIKRLAQWVDEKKIDKIYVDIFTNENLDYRMKGKYAWWKHSTWWYWLGEWDLGEFPKGNYLAVSATFMQEGRATPRSVFGPQGNEYKWLDGYEPVAQIGNSIFVYYIPK